MRECFGGRCNPPKKIWFRFGLRDWILSDTPSGDEWAWLERRPIWNIAIGQQQSCWQQSSISSLCECFIMSWALCISWDPRSISAAISSLHGICANANDSLTCTLSNAITIIMWMKALFTVSSFLGVWQTAVNDCLLIADDVSTLAWQPDYPYITIR